MCMNVCMCVCMHVWAAGSLNSPPAPPRRTATQPYVTDAIDPFESKTLRATSGQHRGKTEHSGRDRATEVATYERKKHRKRSEAGCIGCNPALQAAAPLAAYEQNTRRGGRLDKHSTTPNDLIARARMQTMLERKTAVRATRRRKRLCGARAHVRMRGTRLIAIPRYVVEDELCLHGAWGERAVRTLPLSVSDTSLFAPSHLQSRCCEASMTSNHTH